MELLWRLYEEDRTFSKHHEQQRTATSGLLVTISAALIAFTAIDQKLEGADVLAGALLIILGLFGAIFTHKQYERSRLHLNRSYAYFDAMNKAIEGVDLEALRRKASEKNEADFPISSKYKLSTLWIILHYVILASGFLVTGAAI
ncbi:MAG TPA: hypothetical protein DET67_17855 [Ruegeria sp.]|nr:hypothetical protein [Ruegeria sp.]